MRLAKAASSPEAVNESMVGQLRKWYLTTLMRINIICKKEPPS
jgi:hypothetical protein